MSTYLHNGVEVKLTGRTAFKDVGKEGSRRGIRQDIQHEVTPAEPDNGGWTAWVRLADLYEIKEI